MSMTCLNLDGLELLILTELELVSTLTFHYSLSQL